jgi:transcriptional regulator with XRE-family HTH domain
MLHSLRSLRRSRNLTFQDLASLTGIPVRLLAEAEYDLRSLSSYERFQLALVFGVAESDFASIPPKSLLQPNPLHRTVRHSLVIGALAATLVTSALRSQSFASATGSVDQPLPEQNIELQLAAAAIDPEAQELMAAMLKATTSPEATSYALSPTNRPTSSPTVLATPTLEPSMMASATPEPTATLAPPPSYWLSEAGPVGCPIDGQGANIVINQAYGVGTHAPIETMGGIDLAIDRNGDGLGEASSTLYAPVVATHSGIVQIDHDTWPAGNHIWVIDQATGWRTGYGHLDRFLVEQGSYVEAGMPIATVGLTGYTTGPHLHYHVWHGDRNIDPTNLVGICQNLSS